MMWKALFKGGIIGGVVAYIWLMISWVFLPWHCGTIGFSNRALFGNFFSLLLKSSSLRYSRVLYGVYYEIVFIAISLQHFLRRKKPDMVIYGF